MGLARRGTIAGISFAEYYPSLDLNGIAALAIVRLTVDLIAAILSSADPRSTQRR